LKQPLFRNHFNNDPYGNHCHYVNVDIRVSELIDLKDKRAEIMDRVSHISAEDKNAVSCTRQFIKILKDQDSSIDEKAIALRYLIHVIGDIFQPLHDFTVVQDESPFRNNQGGFLLRIPQVPIRVLALNADDSDTTPARNLHSLWDAGLGAFLQLPYQKITKEEDLERIGSAEGLEYISSTAKDLEDLVKQISERGDEDIQKLDNWITDGILLGLNEVYEGVDLHEEEFPFFTRIFNLKSYLRKGKSTCRYQMALGGVRLANVLNSLFDS
jgi:hypothetical protein